MIVAVNLKSQAIFVEYINLDAGNRLVDEVYTLVLMI